MGAERSATAALRPAPDRHDGALRRRIVRTITVKFVLQITWALSRRRSVCISAHALMHAATPQPYIGHALASSKASVFPACAVAQSRRLPRVTTLRTRSSARLTGRGKLTKWRRERPWPRRSNRPRRRRACRRPSHRVRCTNDLAGAASPPSHLPTPCLMHAYLRTIIAVAAERPPEPVDCACTPENT